MNNKPKIDYSKLKELSQKAEWFLRNPGDAAVHGPYYEHQMRHESSCKAESNSTAFTDRLD